MDELASALADYKPLSHKETLVLIRRVQKRHAHWRDAQKTLILRNYRLITKVALSWHHKFTSTVVTYDDLVQQAQIGYLNAIAKYDPRRGVRFSTYAVASMNRTLERHIDECGQEIRVSVHLSKRKRRRTRATNDLRQELGRPPTIDEVAEAMNLSTQKIDRLDALPTVAFSLDEPTGEDGQGDRHDQLSHSSHPDLVEGVEGVEGQAAQTLIDFIQGALPAREARIVLLYFGLYPSHPSPPEPMGELVEPGEGAAWAAGGRLSYIEIAKLEACSVLSVKRTVAGALKLLRLPLYSGALTNLLKE